MPSVVGPAASIPATPFAALAGAAGRSAGETAFLDLVADVLAAADPAAGAVMPIVAGDDAKAAMAALGTQTATAGAPGRRKPLAAEETEPAADAAAAAGQMVLPQPLWLPQDLARAALDTAAAAVGPPAAPSADPAALPPPPTPGTVPDMAQPPQIGADPGGEAAPVAAPLPQAAAPVATPPSAPAAPPAVAVPSDPAIPAADAGAVEPPPVISAAPTAAAVPGIAAADRSAPTASASRPAAADPSATGRGAPADAAASTAPAATARGDVDSAAAAVLAAQTLALDPAADDGAEPSEAEPPPAEGARPVDAKPASPPPAPVATDAASGRRAGGRDPRTASAEAPRRSFEVEGLSRRDATEASTVAMARDAVAAEVVSGDAAADGRAAAPTGGATPPDPTAPAIVAVAADLTAAPAGVEPRAGDGGITALAAPDATTAAGRLAADAVETRAATAEPQRPEVAAQVVTAIHGHVLKGDRSFEIRLDPSELGRVDVRLQISGDGEVRAHLVVERTETLDMMLRDQRGLERSLEQSGVKVADGAISFSLRQDGGQDQQQGWRNSFVPLQEQQREGGGDGAETRTVAAANPYQRPARAGGIDVRV